jgi:hypothetical protein
MEPNMTPDDPQWSEQEIEARRSDFAPFVPPIPGIDPAISQDPDLYAGAHLLAALPAMGTKPRMIYASQRFLGTGESPPDSNHNGITDWFNQHIAHIGNGPWCDMALTKASYDSGCLVAVCGGNGKGFAFVPAHMAWGRLKYGIHHGSVPPAGAVVGFRWDGAKGTTDCDHIGVCERDNKDGTFSDLEGNIANAYRREHRDLTYVSCWFMPAYVTMPTPAPSSSADSSWFQGVS